MNDDSPKPSTNLQWLWTVTDRSTELITDLEFFYDNEPSEEQILKVCNDNRLKRDDVRVYKISMIRGESNGT